MSENAPDYVQMIKNATRQFSEDLEREIKAAVATSIKSTLTSIAEDLKESAKTMSNSGSFEASRALVRVAYAFEKSAARRG